MKRKMAAVAAALLLFLAGGGVVWASSNYKQIGVYFEKIQFIINNQYVPLTKEAIIYEGTVYVPLRDLGVRLGAAVRWNPEQQAVEYTFSPNKWTALNLAGRKGLYQYIIIENDSIMRSMAEALRSDNMDLLKEAAVRYDQLVKFATELEARDRQSADYEIVQLLTKIRAAAELLHTGWMARNLDDYYLAMDIFQTNERMLLERLQSIIDGMGQ
jgi:hypothetical protein